MAKTNTINNNQNLTELISIWKKFLEKNNNWEQLVQGTPPKQSGCGIIYELGNPLKRPNENFSIADMRKILFAESHYHPDDNYEFYFALQGSALIVVGRKEMNVTLGDVVIIPPNTAHFALPDRDFIIAVVNTPPFKSENYIVVSATNHKVKFDKKQFEALCEKNKEQSL